MSKIKSVTGREIIDSRGNPTVEVICELLGGTTARASVPSGASIGVHEVLELRDHDQKRYGGLGVLTAVRNVNDEISRCVKDREFDQQTLDQALVELDGTANKSRIGANATLGVSLSFARAKSIEEGVELYQYLGGLVHNKDFKLPQPMFNIINGGKHADSGLDIQEFMVVPIDFKTIREKIQSAAEIISALRKILKEKGHTTSVGDEGGFTPKLSSNEEGLEFIVQAIEGAGYSTEIVKIGVDAAASSFYNDDNDGSYRLRIAGQEISTDSAGMVDWYEKLVGAYPIISIEDGLAEDDWEGFTNLTKRLGNKVCVIGDDLTVTNIERIKIAFEKKSLNSVIIKPNQIGTLMETLRAIELTKEQHWTPVVSHRSGETTDTFIADLAVGLSCDYIKSGSLVRGERVCKYNRLMEIEDMINI
ncbi:MAG: phosphopyruvate hydratase [bacterium]|nr:phosphopyruvate hydratase [bacterium]